MTSVKRSISALWHGVISLVERRNAALPETDHLITFTFDDFYKSAYVLGGRILAEAGARGTYYASMGLMNTGTMFQSEDATRLVIEGHELACHTFSHLSSRQHSTAIYRADADKGKAAVAALCPDGACNHFSYPFGHVTVSAKREMGRLFTTCRGIWSGVNGPVLDLNLLRANRLYSASVPLAEVQRLIDESRRRRGWLIFYTHDVSETPTEFGCTPRYFEAAVKYARASQARIVTVSEAARSLKLS